MTRYDEIARNRQEFGVFTMSSVVICPLTTSQVPPLPQRTLPGGFTVGERAVHLARLVSPVQPFRCFLIGRTMLNMIANG